MKSQDKEFEQWLSENNPKKAMNVPEGYFDGFADDLMRKVNVNETISEKKGKSGFRLLYLYSAVAASACLVLAIMFLMPSNDEYSGEFIADDYNDDSTWGYVMQYSEDLSLSDIAAFPEAGSVIEDFEYEIFGNDITENFIDDTDIEIIEDIYQ